jgi:peptidoglycan hydrolase-like protein with peptidoglycan-binding domain/DNA invertase Pin-like site-specific DNA recombinase
VQRTFLAAVKRAGPVGLVAMLVLLALPGASIAGGASDGPAAIVEAGAEPLVRGDGYGTAGPAQRVRQLQHALGRLGWQPGPVDGLFGPRTEAAVKRFQRSAVLVPDGIVGPKTSRALRAARGSPLRLGAGYPQPAGSPRVRMLQSRLGGLGLRPGPVDGRFGPLTQAAVVRLQRAGGLPADGIVGSRTRRLLANNSSALGKQPGRRDSAPETKPDRDRAPAADGRIGSDSRPESTPAAPGDREVRRPQPTADRQLARAREQRGRPQNRQARARDEHAPAGAAGARARGSEPGPADGASPAQGAIRTSTRSEDGADVALLVGLVVLALAVAVLIGALLGRFGPARGISIPLADGVVAEGHARARSIGRFRGQVNALVVRNRGLWRKSMARYLVSDPVKRKPFWVTHDEVATIVARRPAAAHQPKPDEAPPTDGVRAVGYASVAAGESLDGPQLKAQAAAIDTLCEERGWRLLQLVDDVEGPPGTALERPGLSYALERISSGEAGCLIVSQLQRLSPSVTELGRILEVIGRGGGRLVALDLEIDTATPSGRKAANVLVSVTAWERERLAARTRKGLEAAPAKGGASSRPALEDVAAVKEWIAHMRKDGLTLQAIADRLNDEGVPTLRGGEKWRPSSVQTATGYRRPQQREPDKSEATSEPEKGRA